MCMKILDIGLETSTFKYIKYEHFYQINTNFILILVVWDNIISSYELCYNHHILILFSYDHCRRASLHDDRRLTARPASEKGKI